MRRPLAYITAPWGDNEFENTETAARYCRMLYDAGYSPVCPLLCLPLFLKDEIPQEHKLLDYGTLCKKTDEVTARFHELSGQIKAAEERMTELNTLRKHIINYAKTREIYVAYRKAGYSKKFLAEHEGDILLHKAAKKAFDDMGIKKLPTVKSIQAEYAGLLAEKKKLYPEYSAVRQEMKDLQMAKANVARLLGYEEKEKEKENRETPVNEKETTNRSDPLL